MEHQTVAEAVEQTIAEAVARNIVDERLHAAPIAAVRFLAARADESVGSDKVDNVTMPTLLRYLDAMGIVGGKEQAAPQPAERPAQGSSLDAMRRKFRAVSGGRAS